MSIVLKSGSLKLLEPSEPLQAYNGNALPFYLYLLIVVVMVVVVLIVVVVVLVVVVVVVLVFFLSFDVA